jgi:hypothetical protein
MFSGGRMNDDSLASARRFNFPHAESDSFEPPTNLGCAKVDAQSIAFDDVHFQQNGELP